jgi:DNA-binding winged helix-turn-helix (wHTH) protein
MAMTRDNSSMASDRSSRAAAEAMLEFGRFRVLLRQRQLVADGVPIELGTRALDLLLVLLKADGSLVTKDELFHRVWPGIVVSEANLKVQICALRRALGEDRDCIRTEFGRGYRFTAAVRSTVAWGRQSRHRRARGGRVVGATRGSPRRNRANASPTEQSSPRAVRHCSLSSRSFSSGDCRLTAKINPVLPGLAWPARQREQISSMQDP